MIKQVLLILTLIFTFSLNSTFAKNTKSTPIIIDVRTQGEWNLEHVKGALHIPISQFSKRLSEIQKATKNKKTNEIIVYCAVGGRASKAKTILENKGYTKVTNAGGLEDMRKLNHKIEK